MAKRKGILGGLMKNNLVMYSIYGIVGYYAYTWLMQPKSMQSTQITVPPGTQS